MELSFEAELARAKAWIKDLESRGIKLTAETKKLVLKRPQSQNKIRVKPEQEG